jgi:hypothetical protein
VSVILNLEGNIYAELYLTCVSINRGAAPPKYRSETSQARSAGLTRRAGVSQQANSFLAALSWGVILFSSFEEYTL